MRTPLLTATGLIAFAILFPGIALAGSNPNSSVRSESSISFPESDRKAARREANRERRSESRQRQQQRSQQQPHQRSRPEQNRQPRIARGDAPIIGYNPVIPDESGRNHRNRDHSRDRNRSRDHARNDRRSRDPHRFDRRGSGYARDPHRLNGRYYSGRPHRRNLSLAFSFGTTGYGNYGNRYGFGYGRNYGRPGHFSFLGGNYYHSSYDLYPWWYGDSQWGYRTRSNYRLGYGHIGHSNVYCTDPYHQSYGLSWGVGYNNQYFSPYSNTTDGSYGGYSINSCYLENKRGYFGRRKATIRVTLCWDEYSRQYVETGAVQLISYY